MPEYVSQEWKIDAGKDKHNDRRSNWATLATKMSGLSGDPKVGEDLTALWLANEAWLRKYVSLTQTPHSFRNWEFFVDFEAKPSAALGFLNLRKSSSGARRQSYELYRTAIVSDSSETPRHRRTPNVDPWSALNSR